jgi:hypothetical protein
MHVVLDLLTNMTADIVIFIVAVGLIGASIWLIWRVLTFDDWRTSVFGVGSGLLALVFAFVAFIAAGLIWHQWHDSGPGRADPQPIALGPGSYVALGDYYSAGEGNPPWVAQFDAAGNHCDRSKYAYAKRVSFTQPPVALDFSACAGARIKDVIDVGNAPSLERAHVGRLQIDALKADHDVKLVTITISGNDAEFSDVLNFCATTGHCLSKPYGGSATLEDWARARLDVISSALPDLFEQVHEAAPDARVLVLGYPELFAPSTAPIRGPFCALISSRWGSDERDGIRALEHDLNDRINRAATRSGLEFVATEFVFQGHEACSPHEWTRFVTAGPGAFHPNTEGQERFAQIVKCHLALHPTTSYLYDQARSFEFTVTRERLDTSSSGDADDTALRDCVLGQPDAPTTTTSSQPPPHA